LINANNIKFAYNDSSNFKLDCSEFLAEPSKLTCIIGGNGSGKSTLLKIFGRKITPHKGSIYIDNKNINDYDFNKISDLIGWIDPSLSTSLVEELYVLDHYALTLYASGHKIPFFYRRLKNIQKKNEFIPNQIILKQINNLILKKVGNLSAGQKQNLSITLASIMSKKILLSDESTSNLDVYYSQQFFETMKAIATENSSTIIIVTHDILLASEFSDALYFIDNGKVQKIDINNICIDERINNCKIKIFASNDKTYCI